MMHAWLIKKKPYGYYIQDTVFIPFTSDSYEESNYERDVRIARYYRGINGEIYSEISQITQTKDEVNETDYLYLGEVVKL